jgi:outer membrane autotransporter protein
MKSAGFCALRRSACADPRRLDRWQNGHADSKSIAARSTTIQALVGPRHAICVDAIPSDLNSKDQLGVFIVTLLCRDGGATHSNNLGLAEGRRLRISTSVLALVLAGGLAFPGYAFADTDWKGTVSDDWYDAGNWTNGAPDVAAIGVATNIDSITPNITVINGAAAASGSLYVGVGNTGSLDIVGGGNLLDALGTVGAGAGSNGTVSVSGSGSEWTNSTGLFVGFNGTGTINVTNAGVLTGPQGFLGFHTGSTGTVNVDGAGSAWTNSGYLSIGYRGTGTMAVSNGGTVSSGEGHIGTFAGAIGAVTVNGLGSIWINNGDLFVGEQGTGTLTVANGGTISNSGGGYIGMSQGANGLVTIDGSGSQLGLAKDLFVGVSGSGTLAISNGGAVYTGSGASVWVGQNGGSSDAGTLTVDGAGSLLSSSGAIGVGVKGTGVLTVTNGGSVQSVSGVIGQDAIGVGMVTIDGVGSNWVASGDITVGDFGTGGINIINGGKVWSSDANIGVHAGSTGIAQVDGAGSLWTVGGAVVVGDGGTGTLAVINGGAVHDMLGGYVGYGKGSFGSAAIDGAGSEWQTDADLHVGYNGNGSLSITNGGLAKSANGAIGELTNGVGSVTVDGAGSTWIVADLTVGGRGKGSLAITNGGAVNSAHAIVGSANGGTGIVTVSGPGSTWTNIGTLMIGKDGNGTLTINNGGAAVTNQGTVGEATGAGTVTVDGPGSTWVNVAALDVGSGGVGNVTVSNGGKVSDVFGALGVYSSGQGTFTVTGAGSSWINSDLLTVGDAGAGTLNILNGGSVSNAKAYVGGAAGHTGTGIVTVDGAGSTWTNSNNIYVGHYGTGTLNITNGGLVSSAGGYLGDVVGSTGNAAVNGPGSSWAVNGSLSVGNNGAGTLTIANRGVVSVGGVAVLASQAGSTGTLNIGGAVGAAPTGAGTLNAANIVFGLGTGAINFNHTDANYTFVPAISGVGTINQLAGNTNLTSDSSGFNGATNVTGGRLAVNGSLANSLVTVSGGGILGGNGIVGGIVANAGGIIGPGNSIGTLNINGNLTQGAGSTYQVELTSAGSSDPIKAAGTATIANGALLNVVKMDAAPYVLGAHYTVLQADGGVSGTYTLTGNAGTAFISLIDHYDPTHVYLDVTQTKSFAAAGFTPNQIATGAGAESLGSGNPIYNAIIMLPTDAVARAAFDQLSGEVHASMRTALIEDSRFLRNAVNDRIRAAFDSVGASNGTVTTYVDGKPVTVAANTDRLAVWGEGFGSWGHTNSDGNAARLNRSTGGFFIGADAPVFDTWRFGAVAGYSHTSFDVKDRRSSGSSDNYHVGLYGGTAWGDLAFRTGAAYTWHDISTNRSVAFPGFADRLSGNYNAGTAQVFGELGYGINMGAARFEPFANLAYVNLHTDGFTERGGAAALTSASANTDATFATLGLRASTRLDLNGAVMTAKGMLGWRHAFGDVTPLSTTRFAGAGNAFTIGGVPIARDAAAIEAGLGFAITPAASLGVTYGGQFGSGLTDQSVKANFNVKF